MKKLRTKKRKRNFFDLTPAERDREVARFDRPIDIDKESRPMTAKERALFERMIADKPPFTQMSLAELRAATKQFDKPTPPSKLRPMNKDERAEFKEMQRSSGRSVFVGPRRKQEVKVKLDQSLLRRCNAYATQHDLTLSDVINKSLAATLAFVD